MFVSINPHSTERFGELALMDRKAVDQMLAAAQQAFAAWHKRSADRRAEALNGFAAALERERIALATMMTQEMGKVLSQSIAEVDKCAQLCRFYSAHGPYWLQPEARTLDGVTAKIVAQPLGVIMGIMPWNFPLWQVLRFAVPAWMAGNATVVKPAPNVGLSSEMLARLAQETFGLPLLQMLKVSPEQAGQLISDNRIKGVALTGSEKAGEAVGQAAGAALKPSVLELGGSDAFIILPDADLPMAVETLVKSRLQVNGQTCISAKRTIIHKNLLDDFLGILEGHLVIQTPGDPLSEGVTIGPLARPDLHEKLRQQVNISVQQGASLVYTGSSLPVQGWHYPIQVLVQPPPGSLAYREELFGPVFCVYSYQQEEEAIFLANDTAFGLGASVWTKDEEIAQALALELDCGTVSINKMVASDPRFPFGGMKRSGYGRELGWEGLRAFTNIKTVV